MLCELGILKFYWNKNGILCHCNQSWSTLEVWALHKSQSNLLPNISFQVDSQDKHISYLNRNFLKAQIEMYVPNAYFTNNLFN